MILIAVLLYLVKIIAGAMLAHLIWDSREPKHLLLKLFLGTGLGFGVSSLLYFLWFVIRFPPVMYPYFELIVFLALLTINVVKEYKRKNIGQRQPFKNPDAQTRIWGGLSLTAFAISAVSFWLYAIKNPHGYNDAWAIWNVAARFIYRASDHWLAILPQNAWQHADYPLMVSLNIAEGWLVTGSDSTRIPMLIAFAFFVSIIGLLFSAIASAKDFQQAALAALVIASVSQLPFLSAWQYSDAPLSYFFLATGTLFYLYAMLGDTRLLILAGLFAALSGWTKNEGVTFAVISLLLCLILSFQQKKNLLKSFTLGAVFPALVIIFFKTLTPANDLFVDKAQSIAQLLDISRYQIISAKLIEFLLSFGGWPVSFVVILIGYSLLVFIPPSLKTKPWQPALLCMAQFLGYFVIYLITPHELVLHLNTSLDRLLFHLFPLTMFVLFTTIASPREIFGTKTT